MAAFPQWKAEAATSAVWFSEIGGMDREKFIAAVRSLMNKNPSPFPPGVFEIRKEAMPPAEKRPGAEQAWGIGLKSMNESASLVWTEEIAQAMGACHEQILAHDLVGARMAFKEKYEQLVEEAEGRPVKWLVSLGHDKFGRAGVVEKAYRDGLIPSGVVHQLLPPDESVKILGPEPRLITGGAA